MKMGSAMERGSVRDWQSSTLGCWANATLLLIGYKFSSKESIDKQWACYSKYQLVSYIIQILLDLGKEPEERERW